MGRRVNVYPQPWRKHMEVFQDFSGGLNTVTTNDRLRDNELTNLVNIDLAERGTLRRRSGFVETSVRRLTWDFIGPKKWSEL